MTAFRLILAALLVVAFAGAPQAQLSLMGIGPAGSGTGIAACGTGVIDLSAGCSLPIMLGLVP